MIRTILLSDYVSSVDSTALCVVETVRMKLLLVLMLCGLVAAAPKVDLPNGIDLSSLIDAQVSDSDIINALLQEVIEAIRLIIYSGSVDYNLPPLDPLVIDDYRLYIPSSLINLDLDLKNSVMTGIGAFVMHRSFLDLNDLSIDIDLSIPTIDIFAEQYYLVGDLLSIAPLYGKGKAEFKANNFGFRGKVFLKQSDDGKSAIIGNVQNASFRVPYFRSHLTGVIGGGSIDDVVNRIIEEVLVDYVNRFQGYIASVVARVLPQVLNPVLEQFDTWKYIDAVTS